SSSAFSQNQLAGLLRDEFALGLTPPIKSIGMGGAYVGIDAPQSMNPAALSSVDYYEAMLWYGFYDLDHGPNAHRGRFDGLLKVPYLGGGARLMLDGMKSDGAASTLLPGNAAVEFDEI